MHPGKVPMVRTWEVEGHRPHSSCICQTDWPPSCEYSRSAFISSLLMFMLRSFSQVGTIWSKGPHINASFWKLKSSLHFTSAFLMFRTEERHMDETLCGLCKSLKRTSEPSSVPWVPFIPETVTTCPPIIQCSSRYV